VQLLIKWDDLKMMFYKTFQNELQRAFDENHFLFNRTDASANPDARREELVSIAAATFTQTIVVPAHCFEHDDNFYQVRFTKVHRENLHGPPNTDDNLGISGLEAAEVVEDWAEFAKIWQRNFLREVEAFCGDGPGIFIQKAFDPKDVRDRLTQVMWEAFKTATEWTDMCHVELDAGVHLCVNHVETTVNRISNSTDITLLDAACRDLTDYLTKILTQHGLLTGRLCAPRFF